MQLRRIQISRFRGVRELDWRHIGPTAALVGPGDSPKSTILEAVERALAPTSYVRFHDIDFWNADPSSPIDIRCTITDLPHEFLRDTKFGLHLSVWDETEGAATRPKGEEEEELALVLQLLVDETLEPTWSVLNAEEEPVTIRPADRERLGMLRIGGYLDQHLAWRRGSALARITKDGDRVDTVLAESLRSARSGLDLSGLERLQEAATHAQELAATFGALVPEDLTPNMDASTIPLHSGALSLHSGALPARRLGLGTRRLLAMAMQDRTGLEEGITLIDEFEHGLEPHRIRKLLRVLRGKAPEKATESAGQLLLTTHSPTVVSELDSSEIKVVRVDDTGEVEVRSVSTRIDYVLARCPEAMLAKKIIVAEGATELGICHALDNWWTTQSDASMAYRGVYVVDGGGGTQPSEIAGRLSDVGYEVALLVDADAAAKTNRAGNALVLAWADKMCTEERVATDLPKSAIRLLCKHAIESPKSTPKEVREKLADLLKIPRNSFPEDAPEDWIDHVDEVSFRSSFGEGAKKKGWFKTVEQGEVLGQIIVDHWDDLDGTNTRAIVEALKRFVHE